MRIFFYSRPFYPNIGGLETVSLLLAREFACAGHEVVVLTESADDGSDQNLPFEVVRRPSLLRLLQLTRWADIVFHNNISLRAAWPLIFIWRPWVVAHHIWLPTYKWRLRVVSAIKRLALRHARGVAISQAVAMHFLSECDVIGNPYDSDIFKLIPDIGRDRELLFVGRFVSDKGLPDLLTALVSLGDRGIAPRLTVVGVGPEEHAWRQLTDELGLSARVRFVGPKRGKELAEEFNRHKVLVIPSLWYEPFGLVALEGMACGCVVVGSNGGGLGEAIGPAGLTYPNGDVGALSEGIVVALTDEYRVAHCRLAVADHLKSHSPAYVAARYLDVFRRMLAEAAGD